MMVESKDLKGIILAGAVSILAVQSIHTATNPGPESSGRYGLDAYSDVKLMVHFMPWYQTPAVSGYWGWHWTMDHFNPANMDVSGRREIASHHYPLTGPYDSRDEDILEYQALLMKLAGIDGVIVDWYGIEEFWDYGVINRSTQAIFDRMKMAGLLFSVCYEDRTIGLMVDNYQLDVEDVYLHGRSVMSYLQNAWFGDDTYLKLSGQPVLLTFGPNYFKQSSEWDTLFSVLDPAPLFFTLDNRLPPVAAGAFPWPPMWASDVSGVLSTTALNNYLAGFYEQAKSWDYLVAGAFPGFHDIYSEAGLGFSYGYLDPQNGETFNNTLRTAVSNSPDIIQIVTWNDYGEGTIVEPTWEFGYQYLEMIQTARRDSIDPAFPYTAADLEIPLEIFNLRKAFETDNEMNATLDRVFTLIIAGDLPSAAAVIDSIGALNNITGPGAGLPGQPQLRNCYPNPFNPTTVLRFDLPVATYATLVVYDLAGREIRTLVKGEHGPGAKSVTWDGNNNTGQPMSSGVYIARLVTPEYFKSIKMLLLK